MITLNFFHGPWLFFNYFVMKTDNLGSDLSWFLFDGAVEGDTEHILINPACSLQLCCNKHTHYLPFQKAADG